jgi:ATPase subunit of ABC transporter with duplicated ATPase domains
MKMPAAALAALCLAVAACGAKKHAAEEPQADAAEASDPAPAGESAEATGQADLGKAFVLHVLEVIKIIQKNQGQCQAALEQSLAYIDQHRDVVEKGSAYFSRLKEERGGEKKLEEYEGLAEQLMPEVDAVMDAFEDVCHAESDKIGLALGLD